MGSIYQIFSLEEEFKIIQLSTSKGRYDFINEEDIVTRLKSDKDFIRNSYIDLIKYLEELTSKEKEDIQNILISIRLNENLTKYRRLCYT